MQKILFLFGTVISLPVLVANEACEFSRWGEGDEIGNANLINAESILELTGKVSDLIKAYNSPGIIGLGNEKIILSDTHTLSDLVQFSNLTTGTISLSDNSIGLEGSSSEIASALALNLNDSYKGDITITNNDYSKSELNTIFTSSAGSIVLNNTQAANLDDPLQPITSDSTISADSIIIEESTTTSNTALEVAIAEASTAAAAANSESSTSGEITNSYLPENQTPINVSLKPNALIQQETITAQELINLNEFHSEVIDISSITKIIGSAEQINKTETYRDPDSFADIVRGMHLYGRKILRPEALVNAIYNLR